MNREVYLKKKFLIDNLDQNVKWSNEVKAFFISESLVLKKNCHFYKYNPPYGAWPWDSLFTLKKDQNSKEQVTTSLWEEIY